MTMPTHKETHTINLPTTELRDKYAASLTGNVDYQYTDGAEDYPFGLIFNTQKDRSTAIDILTNKFA